MPEFMNLLAAGGDLSTMLIVYLAYRFDKRVSQLEWITGSLEK